MRYRGVSFCPLAWREGGRRLNIRLCRRFGDQAQGLVSVVERMMSSEGALRTSLPSRVCPTSVKSCAACSAVGVSRLATVGSAAVSGAALMLRDGNTAPTERRLSPLLLPALPLV